jgi:hypothetical protein
MDHLQLLIWIVVIGTGVGVIAYHRRRVQETAAMLRTLAVRRGGRVVDGTLLGWPRLEIQQGGRSVALHPVSGGKHSPDRTIVEIRAAFPPELRLIAQGRGPLAVLTKEWGLEEISSPDQAFARAFVVQGDPVGLARGVLTADAQAQLLRLREHKPRLHLKDGRLSLSIDRIPRELAGFEGLITAATTLADAVSAARTEHGWSGDRPAASRSRRRHGSGAQRLAGRRSLAVALGVAILVAGAALFWMTAHARPTNDRRTVDPTVGDLSNHSYSGHRGRVLGLNADGVPLRLDELAGAFVLVDMEGPWCGTSNSQARTIRALTATRPDVTFVTLVTSDREPLSTPDQGSARRWANTHGLPPARVVAYDSTMTVPHHILYSPTGQTLFRHTGYLPADQLQAILDQQVHRWHAVASAE